MKDTVIVDGKLVEVGYKIIADGVTDGFAKIMHPKPRRWGKSVDNSHRSG